MKTVYLRQSVEGYYLVDKYGNLVIKQYYKERHEAFIHANKLGYHILYPRYTYVVKVYVEHTYTNEELSTILRQQLPENIHIEIQQ